VRVLISPDKFKGTLSAREAAEALADGWRRVRPEDELKLLPITDGGDGFGRILSNLLGCRARKLKTVDAAHRPCTAAWFWDPKARTAVIESAAIIGLAMLPAGKFHPFELDTFGLGAVLQAAARLKPRLCVIGVGGSATNDGGLGLARGLGWRFLDSAGDEVSSWIQLHRLSEIRPPRQTKLFAELLIATDVTNPLLGPRGASRVYGPQKGLQPADADMATAEINLRRLAQGMKQTLGEDWSRKPGAGAAGGLGFGLMAFLGGRPISGFELFARYAKFEALLRHTDLVLTGEGKLDASTLMGKGVGQLARMCRRARVPCIGFAGTVQLDAKKARVFDDMFALTDFTSHENAKRNARHHLIQVAQKAAHSFAR